MTKLSVKAYDATPAELRTAWQGQSRSDTGAMRALVKPGQPAGLLARLPLPSATFCGLALCMALVGACLVLASALWPVPMTRLAEIPDSWAELKLTGPDWIVTTQEGETFVVERQ